MNLDMVSAYFRLQGIKHSNRRRESVEVLSPEERRQYRHLQPIPRSEKINPTTGFCSQILRDYNWVRREWRRVMREIGAIPSPEKDEPISKEAMLAALQAIEGPDCDFITISTEAERRKSEKLLPLLFYGHKLKAGALALKQTKHKAAVIMLIWDKYSESLLKALLGHEYVHIVESKTPSLKIKSVLEDIFKDSNTYNEDSTMLLLYKRAFQQVINNQIHPDELEFWIESELASVSPRAREKARVDLLHECQACKLQQEIFPDPFYIRCHLAYRALSKYTTRAVRRLRFPRDSHSASVQAGETV